MRGKEVGQTTLAALMMILAGCAPRAAPVAAPGAPRPSPVVSSPAAPAPSPREAAWAQVVEAAKKEGQLNLYTFNISGDPGRAITRAFEQKYGIKVEAVTGVGSVLIERIQSERAAGKYVGDTLDSALSLVATAKQRGFTQSWGDLPVFAESGVWTRHPGADPDGHMITMGDSIFTPFINTNLVKMGNEPKSVKDLLEPKWGGGKIVIASPVTTPSIIYWYVAKLVDDDFLSRIVKNNPIIAPTVRDSTGVLLRGEAAIELPSPVVTVADFVAKGAPVKPIELAEGVAVTPGGTMVMVQNAPHPNAARLFANWLLTQEGQTAYHKAKSTTSIRKDVPSFLPPAADIKYKKVITLSLNEMLQAERLQREGAIAKIMGVEK